MDWIDFRLVAPDEAAARACAAAIQDVTGGALQLLQDGEWWLAWLHHAFDPIGAVEDQPAGQDQDGNPVPATYLPGWRANLRIRTSREAEVTAMLQSIGASFGVDVGAVTKREWAS